MMGKKLPEGWGIKQFLECIEKEVSSNKLKIPKSEFQNKGKYPIIDQGTEYIAGYTDNPLKVYKGELPVIIFGDHTRIFKFVDFPFSLGADGTKVLVPKKDLLYSKYFYFFLHRLKIESHGYSRHYKFLKEKQIVIPPLQTQKKIVSILEKADETKRLRMQAGELTNQLLQSVFLEMFVDDTTIPKLWKWKTIEECMETIIDYRGKTPPKTSSGIPLITAKIVKHGEILEPAEFISPDFYDTWMVRGIPKYGDVLFTTEGPLGIVAQLKVNEKVALAQRIILLRGKENLIDNSFLVYAFVSQKVRQDIESRATGSTVKGIRQKELRKVKIPVPTLDLQQKFAQIVEKVESMRQSQKQSQQEIDNLFNVLMQKAFKGELTP